MIPDLPPNISFRFFARKATPCSFYAIKFQMLSLYTISVTISRYDVYLFIFTTQRQNGHGVVGVIEGKKIQNLLAWKIWGVVC
jgi:hypothetical protein